MNSILSKITNLEKWQKTLYIVFFAQLISVVGFASIFPFLPLYVQSLESRSSLSVELLSGLVFSAQAFTMMIASPIWGSIADRYGRKLMIERAMFGGAFLVLWMGFVNTAEGLIALRALQGAVTGTISAANAMVASVVPRNKMGFAMGLMQVALWGGVAVGPLMGGILADAFGYQLSFVITAALLFLGGLMIVFWVQEEFTPVQQENGQRPSILEAWKHIFAAAGVKTAFTIRFITGLAQVLIVPIAPLFIISLLPADAPVNFYTGLIIGVGGAASTVTAIYFGRLGDRIGHRKILIASSLAAAFFYFPQGLVTAAWQLFILQALAGAALGGIITTLTALLAQFTTQGEEGSVYGLDASLVSGSRVFAPLMGASIAYWFSLRLAISLNGFLFLAVFFLAVFILPKPQTAHDQTVEQTESVKEAVTA